MNDERSIAVNDVIPMMSVQLDVHRNINSSLLPFLDISTTQQHSPNPIAKSFPSCMRLKNKL